MFVTDMLVTDMFVTTHMFVDDAELPGPQHVVEELTMIVTIVVGSVRLGVIRRRQCRHLVTIDRVVTKEELHFVGNLVSGEQNGMHMLK